MKMTVKYVDQLNNPLWQKRRLEIFEKAGWRCEICQKQEETLHVHHLIYKSGHLPWEYSDKELVSLCKDCHESVHDNNLTGSMVLSLINAFKAGERHAIRMIHTYDDGSEELLNYLKAIN